MMSASIINREVSMRRLFLSILFITLLPAGWAAAAEPAGKTIILPGKREKEYTDYRYAPAIRVGDTVILSGIPAGGPGTYTEQVRRMFARAKSTLEAAGATMDDVIELQSFHANARSTAEFQKEFAELLEVHKEFFKDGYPAWTAIGNAVLLAPGAALEMRFVAVIGAGRNVKVNHTGDTNPGDKP
jgi:enamine deaminase RidA (YjgF/YER057c/UK114 family)